MDGENKKCGVFIIDDDSFLTDMYSVKFLENNFAVDVCGNCREALQKLRSGYAPDIILLDVVMPNMNGIEFLKTIKAENLAKNSKVLILSNLGQKEDIERGLSCGADDYIVKANFTPSEVVYKVKNILTH